jgi:hypothetical protein
MKRKFKVLALIIMAAIFVTLIILPVNLKSDTLMSGLKFRIDNIDTCVCPKDGHCQCLILTFEKP